MALADGGVASLEQHQVSPVGNTSEGVVLSNTASNTTATGVVDTSAIVVPGVSSSSGLGSDASNVIVSRAGSMVVQEQDQSTAMSMNDDVEAGGGSITLTDNGGLTIESGSNTVTVGEGGTVAVENIAALIGALQRAGVPVQLHQAASVEQSQANVLLQVRIYITCWHCDISIYSFIYALSVI